MGATLSRQLKRNGLGLVILIGLAQGCATTMSDRPTGAGGKSGALGPGAVMTNTGGVASNLPPGESKDYREIQTHFSKGLYESAIQKSTAYLKKYPGSVQTAAVENLLGLSLLLTNRPLQAVVHFKKSYEASSDNRIFRQYILYNQAKAQFDANQNEDCLQSLTEIAIDTLDRENRLKVHYLKSRLYARINMPADSVREALIASRLMSDAEAKESRAAFAKSLDQALLEIKAADVLDRLYREFSDAPYADAVLHRLASQELASGASGSSEGHAKELLSRFPDSPHYQQAKELLSSTQSQTIVDTRVVGVLLPLRGKFAKFGQKSLQAIELAFKMFETQETDSGVTLVVEDSGDEPEQALKGLNNLVVKHHAAVVIGPLLSKGISQVTQKAQELGIPLVSLSRNPGFQGDYVFQAGITLQLQAQEIARFAYERLGVRKFAILAPNDKLGEETSQRFWDAVEGLGGKIVGFESYTPGETDFRVPVDKLVGTHFADARQREVDALAKERETANIHRRTRKTEQFFALKPLVDFDAVFLADEPKVAGQVLPTFAYRDVDKLKFLGTSAWNSPVFLERVQIGADQAYFVDAFDAESAAPHVRKFVERYRLMSGQEVTAMEAIAYDAASVVEVALKQAQPSMTRADVKDLLKTVRAHPGVTGKISYKDGQFYRELRAFKPQAGKFVEQSF